MNNETPIESNGGALESRDPDSNPEPYTKRSSTARRIIGRLLAVLLVVSLLLVGYLKREWLAKLVSAQASVQPTGQAGGERKVLYWVDPMHPAYKSDKPGTAPDCGMDLVPVYADGGQSEENLPEGIFKISSEKQQLIGVTSTDAKIESLFKTLRAVGRVSLDETRVAHVHTKTEGWIEEVFVDFTGKLVEKGHPMVSIYSPELVQTQQEFLIARKGLEELRESPFKEAVAGSESLYESARRRLQLWDVTENQIKTLEKTGAPIKALTIFSPHTGFVLTRNAFHRQHVTPDTDLYAIVDLSTVWVIADIYEYEAPEVTVGAHATVTLPYMPGRSFKGKISYIYPQVDSATRTIKARIEIANPKYELKPEMFANVELKIDYGRRVVVPVEAVMDSGAEQTVFIAHEGGYFEPRKVELGAKVDGRVIVLKGLKPGERVVTSGNFLVDSESRLKSAIAGMGMPGMEHGTPPAKAAPPTEGHSSHWPSESVAAKPTKDQPQAAVADHPESSPKPGRKIVYWYSVMHPFYKSDKPGKCPYCGMDLVPKYGEEKTKR